MPITICLNMIVKNESAIITRLLESVLPIIDTFVICDTGSTDNTPDIIKTFFDQKGIKGTITHEPFANFGYNRTVALRQASESRATYALLLDADMVLEISNNFDKQLLLMDAYMLLQKSGDLEYWNTRLIKLRVPAICLGPTHEYYSLPNGALTGKCEDLWIKDLGDGGCKHDKFERDIKLLKDGIEAEPENGRYYFYLANSYADLGNHEDAIQCYKRRIEIGGWHEEIFYSYLRLGHSYNAIGKDELAIVAWIDGYNFYPQRSETIYEITKYYRMKGKSNIALQFCKIGMEIPYPKSDILFIKNNVYDYEFDYELSIIGFYTNYPKLYKVATKLLCQDTNHRQNIISNYKFYSPKLSTFLIYKLGGFEVSEEIDGRKMFASSPCIFKYSQDKYGINIRFVNYKIDNPSGTYNFVEDGKIVTANRVLKNVDISTQIDWTNGTTIIPTNSSSLYVGIEDVKIQSNNDDFRLTGTVQGSASGNLCIGYGHYTDEKFVYDEIKSPYDKPCEKNWVFSSGDNVIYNWHPMMTIGKIVDNSFKIEKMIKTPLFFQDIRGSTHGYEYNGEMWFLCHLVEYANPREYYHLFVVLDKDTHIPKRWSSLFKFDGEKIEFALGLIIEEDKIIISYSTWDSCPTIGIYSKSRIEEELFI